MALKNITVGFHGKYIPLQGVQYIVRAAEILKDCQQIQFVLIGNGQTYKEAVALAAFLGLKNIKFIDRIPFEEVPVHIRSFDMCLGIFGDTPKAKRVIPNKVYEYMAMKKAIITGDTLAARELLVDGHHVLFAKVADPADLAEKIKTLANDEVLRNSLAEAAYTLFKERLTPKSLAAGLLAGINSKHE